MQVGGHHICPSIGLAILNGTGGSERCGDDSVPLLGLRQLKELARKNCTAIWHLP